MYKKSFLWMMMALVSFGAKAQQTKDFKLLIEQQIQALSKAIVSKDSLMLDGLLAPEVSYGHSNALVQTKAQFIHSIMSGEQDYKSNEVFDAGIRLYGKTMAVVNAATKVSMVYKGAPLDMDMKILMVWVCQNNGWKLVARQTVKVV